MVNTENNIKLLDLPIEIIQNIIEYETCKRICQLKSVCKLWKILTPKSIDVKSVILDNKIYHEIYEKYNIYNISQNKCIVGDCCRYEIGYSVVYFPIEELPNYNETDITEEEYYGPLDYPIYGYETPVELNTSRFINMLDKLKICNKGPYIKKNLLYCSDCIKKYNILPKNTTWGTFNTVA